MVLFRSLLVVSLSLLATPSAAAGDGSWSREFDRPGLLGRVFAISEYGGDLVAGGLDVEADGQELGLVARFDGSRWLPLGGGIDGFVVEDFAVFQGELVAAGKFGSADGQPVKSIARWNGSAWQPLGGGIGSSFAIQGTVYALEVFQNELYAAGVFDRADGALVVSNVARWDGAQWHDVAGGIDGEVYALEVGPDGRLYAGGSFSTAGGVQVANVAAWDGSAWSAVGSGLGVPLNGIVRALETHVGRIWAGGYFDVPGGPVHEKLASFDGATWQAEGNFPDSSIGTFIHALQSLGNDLYVGGSIVEVDGVQVDRIARLAGTQWTSIGGVRGFAISNLVLALGVHAGELAVGGNFTYVGTSFAFGAPVVSNSVAKFDGAQWKQVGKGLGFDGSVVGGLFWNGGVVATGAFTEAGRSVTTGVAFFDGNDWSPLGKFDNAAYDAIEFNGELVVAGEFSTVDGQTVHGVAAFDGTAWHGFGGGFGFGHACYALAEYQGELYGGTVGGVRRWNGSAWVGFAPQIFGVVGDLHVHQGVLYYAGTFTVQGGNIASWDGTTQAIVGGGMDDSVSVLASFGGDLLAGGEFALAGGVPARRLARWDGSAWSGIPGVTGEGVTALATFQGELVAGGNPLLGMPNPVYVARFDGAQWHELGGGTSGPPAVPLPDDVGGRLYAGGSFQDAEGRPSWNFGIWQTAGDASTFCASDSVATPCPCANQGIPGHGCDNSASTGGSRLTVAGTASPDTIALSVVGELPTSLTIFLQGDSEISGGVPFGDGVRCIAGAIKRLYVANANGGAVSAPGAGDPSITAQSAALGDPIAPGSTRSYQTYYRDPSLAFCPFPQGNGWNVSNGVRIAW